MSKLIWDKTGEKTYTAGVEQVVLYVSDDNGAYNSGVPWNGITAINESPSGGESNPIYANNKQYGDLRSAEKFSGTIEAYTYPDEFSDCDGSRGVVEGVYVSQQARKRFGLIAKTLIGNDIEGDSYGYKLLLVYNATAAPSSKDHATINDAPEAYTLSWEFDTIAENINTLVGGKKLRPSAKIEIDSTKVDATKLAEFEDIIYGTDDTEATFPSPDEVFAHFGTNLG